MIKHSQEINGDYRKCMKTERTHMNSSGSSGQEIIAQQTFKFLSGSN